MRNILEQLCSQGWASKLLNRGVRSGDEESPAGWKEVLLSPWPVMRDGVDGRVDYPCPHPEMQCKEMMLEL